MLYCIPTSILLERMTTVGRFPDLTLKQQLYKTMLEEFFVLGQLFITLYILVLHDSL